MRGGPGSNSLLMSKGTRVDLDNLPEEAGVAHRIGDTIEYLPVDELARLDLDPLNPRFPPASQGAGQDEILRFTEARYEPILIGRSVARHGFFASEPLIVRTSRAVADLSRRA
jgi:hypothetical protein